MRGYVATTDFSWFTFLRARQPLDEVNFWQPSAHGFNAPAGAPFFFKLKAPPSAIGGFGIFARYEAASTRLAWEAFHDKNGTASLPEMKARVERYSSSARQPEHRIGCIMVSQPVFFSDGEWIEQPIDWKKNVVSGAGYELTRGVGLRIWEACLARQPATGRALPIDAISAVIDTPAAVGAPRFGAPQLVRPRLGQGTFRVAVTAAYGQACAVTGEHSLPVLEAAHIRPYATHGGSHEVSSGLLPRADIHRLFDDGYVTVTPELCFVVSERLQREFANGKAYYKRQGKRLTMPPRDADWPDPETLRWHNENVFEKRVA